MGQIRFLILITIIQSIIFCKASIASDIPELTVVFAEGLEPLCWEENGIAKGEQPEIAQYVIKKLGIKAKYVFFPWVRAQKMVEMGEADLMMTTPNRERFQYAIFGKEMTTPNYWNIFIYKKNTSMIRKARKFKKLEDLKPYTVLDFFGNGWTEVYLKRDDGYRIVPAPRMENLVKMLIYGRADLTITSSISMNWFLHKLKMTDMVEEIDLITPETRFHMTFQLSRKSEWARKGLIRALDKELKEMKDSGEWIKILRKYKDPYCSGRPFKSMLNTEDFYKDYEKYPVYTP